MQDLQSIAADISRYFSQIRWRRAMISRLSWVLFGRWLQWLNTPGFKSDIRAYARRTKFAGANVLRGGTVITDCTVGRATYFGGGFIANSDIGAFVSVGPDVRIGGLGGHPTGWISSHPAFYSTHRQSGLSYVKKDYFAEHQRTSIGNDVWIGAGTIVLDGVAIGDGVVVAAGSVVTRDVTPYTIVGGVPAKLIRKRFDDDTIERLRAVEWWNWPDEQLRRSADLFRQGDVDAFLLETNL